METESVLTPKLMTITLDGKQIAYHSKSEFLVQVGKGSDGRYKTKYTITGNLTQALLLYQGINIGNGYKKRIVCWTFNRPIIARQLAKETY